jgi:hypothetical protein
MHLIHLTKLWLFDIVILFIRFMFRALCINKLPHGTVVSSPHAGATKKYMDKAKLPLPALLLDETAARVDGIVYSSSSGWEMYEP